MTAPRISICIPAYRQPDYFRRALQSVLTQGYEEYEVVITDDSPDDTVAAVVDEFPRDARIRYHRNRERKGSPENWNEAVRLAAGSYIKIMHHDDWFTGRDSLARFVGMLDNNGHADFAFSATYACDAAQQVQYLHRPTEAQLGALRKDPRVLFTGNFIGSPSTTIYRRDAAASFDNRLKWVVDIDFYITLLKRNPAFIFCPEPLIYTTSGASHQVTAESAGNRETELSEWCCLYGKIRAAQGVTTAMLKIMGNLMRKYDVRYPAELLGLGVEAPLPRSLRVLIAINRLLH